MPDPPGHDDLSVHHPASRTSGVVGAEGQSEGGGSGQQGGEKGQVEGAVGVGVALVVGTAVRWAALTSGLDVAALEDHPLLVTTATSVPCRREAAFLKPLGLLPGDACAGPPNLWMSPTLPSPLPSLLTLSSEGAALGALFAIDLGCMYLLLLLRRAAASSTSCSFYGVALPLLGIGRLACLAPLVSPPNLAAAVASSTAPCPWLLLLLAAWLAAHAHALVAGA